MNLHGAGPGSTLILINNRRVAYGGTAALFGDVSRIPLSAVERIEITMDGSYTIYGSDAIAGVINFVLRQDYNGLETEASWAPATGGRVDERRFSQTMGTNWDGANASAVLEYSHRDALLAADRKQGTSDLTPWGGSNYGTLFGIPANVAFGSRIWGLSPFQTALPTPSDFIEGKPTLFDSRESTDLLPDQKRVGAYLSGTIDLSPLVQVNGKALITWRGVTDASGAQGDSLTINPGTPFYANPAGGSEPVTVYYGFLDSLGPTSLRNHVWNGDFDLSVNVQLDTQWKIESSIGYSFEGQHELVGGLFNPYVLASLVAAGSFNPFGRNSEAVLQSIGSHSEFRSVSGLGRESVILRGPLTIGALGDINVIAGFDYRLETFDSNELAGTYASAIQGNSHRNVVATFGQVCVPFAVVSDTVCEGDGKKVAIRPQLTLGARFEYVEGFAGHLTPVVQLLWSPANYLTFKGNWGRSSKAPGLADLMQKDDVIQNITLPGSSSASPVASALLLSGGNSGLLRETSQSWIVGATLKSDVGGGLAASLQYYALDDRNRIDQPEIGADVLTSALTSYLVTHHPTPEQQSAACKEAVFSGSATDCALEHVDDIIDARLHNVSKLITDGVDLDIEQAVDSRFLTSIGVTSTYIFKYVISDLSGTTNLVSSPGYPDQFRMRSVALLDRGSYEVAAVVQYVNGYHDFIDQPNRDVASSTTVDLHFKRRFGVRDGAGSCHSDISVDIQNAFNKSPPFVNSSVGIGFDSNNASILGRVIKLGVRKCW